MAQDPEILRMLGRYGIAPSASAAPQVNRRITGLDPATFFDQASSLLSALANELAPVLASVVEPLAGRWHPSGFVIFPLGTHDSLGTVRLHVWPAGRRHLEPRPSAHVRDIHDHVMHIASHVLLGTYSDDIYGVTLSEGEADAEAPYWVYVPSAEKPAAEVIVPNGSRASASIERARRVGAGDTHVLLAGDFHVPTIPLGTAAATLVVSSHRVNPSGPHILVAGMSGPITGERRMVSEDEAKELRLLLSTEAHDGGGTA